MDPVITRLFKRFENIWGQPWLNRYGSETDFQLLFREWADALQDMSLDEIKKSLEFCRDNCEYPPSIKVFKQGRRSQFGIGYTPQYYRDAKETTSPRLETDRTGHMTASAETVQSALAEIKAKLRGRA